MIGLIAGEKIQEQRGLVEGPFLAAALGENVAKQLLGARAVEEMLLVRRALISVAWRDGDALDAEPFRLVEKGGDAGRVGAVEQGAVNVDAKTLRLGGLQSGNGALVDALLANR